MFPNCMLRMKALVYLFVYLFIYKIRHQQNKDKIDNIKNTKAGAVHREELHWCKQSDNLVFMVFIFCLAILANGANEAMVKDKILDYVFGTFAKFECCLRKTSASLKVWFCHRQPIQCVVSYSTLISI